MWLVAETTTEVRWREWQNVGRKRKTEIEGRGLVFFWPTLDLDFFLLRAGIFLYLLAIDSHWKDLNRWFKVAIMNYQILTTQRCLSWPLWSCAKATMVLISQKEPY
jgi:hypothetical protein